MHNPQFSLSRSSYIQIQKIRKNALIYQRSQASNHYIQPEQIRMRKASIVKVIPFDNLSGVSIVMRSID